MHLRMHYSLLNLNCLPPQQRRKGRCRELSSISDSPLGKTELVNISPRMQCSGSKWVHISTKYMRLIKLIYVYTSFTRKTYETIYKPVYSLLFKRPPFQLLANGTNSPIFMRKVFNIEKNAHPGKKYLKSQQFIVCQVLHNMSTRRKVTF